MSILRKIVGLALAAALTWLFWYAYTNYGQFANVSRLTGLKSLSWLNSWMVEFRFPILAIAGFLVLTLSSWIVRRLKLGN